MGPRSCTVPDFGRDLRDPLELGSRLLFVRDVKGKLSLSKTYDLHAAYFERSLPYDADPGTIEKYGRPQDLPETPF